MAHSAMVGVAVVAVGLACWYQSFHQLAISVAPAPRGLATCPDGVNPCWPVSFRISNRWFARVVAVCTVEVRGVDGELLAAGELNTGEVPLMAPEVDGWSTALGGGWLSMVRPPGVIHLAARCSPMYIHEPQPI